MASPDPHPSFGLGLPEWKVLQSPNPGSRVRPVLRRGLGLHEKGGRGVVPRRSSLGYVAAMRPADMNIPYLIVKFQDLVPTFLAASVATTFTVFLPLESLGEL